MTSAATLSAAADAKILERSAHHQGRGINRFSMIGPGDRVLIGVSGGKDSLALSLALVERKTWVPVDCGLFAVQMEWREYPVETGEKQALDRFYSGESEISRVDRHAATNVYGAPWRINREYLPSEGPEAGS